MPRHHGKLVSWFTINDDKHNRLWHAGRFHLRIAWMKFSWEWCLRTTNWTSAKLIIGGEDRTIGTQLSMRHVVFTTFKALLLPERWHYRLWPNRRETGFTITNDMPQLGTVFVWHRERHSWTRGERIWTKWDVLPYGKWTDRIFGRKFITKQSLQTVRTVIPMPEGSYPATVTLERWTWKRTRAFWSRSRFASEVEPDTAIPVPGKGESSWDCDDDAYYSQSGPHQTVHAAVTSFVGSVLRQRERYGRSIEWQPRKKKEDEAPTGVSDVVVDLEDALNYIDQAQLLVMDSDRKGATVLFGIGERLRKRLRANLEALR